MLRKLIKSIIFRLYAIGLKGHQELLQKQREDDLSKKAKIGANSIVDSLSIIQNNSGDKNRIIIGDNSWIRGHLQVHNTGLILIGNDSFIGPDSRIWAKKKITIGNRVLISHNVNIHDNNSHPLNSRLRHQDFQFIFKNMDLQDSIDLSEADIIIEDDAWIGFNATVLKGVTIGKGAIVGANTVITKDVPAFAVIVGNPAKIIKYTS